MPPKSSAPLVPLPSTPPANIVHQSRHRAVKASAQLTHMITFTVFMIMLHVMATVFMLMLLRLDFVGRIVSPLVDRLIEEVYQTYFMVAAYFFITYTLMTIINRYVGIILGNTEAHYRGRTPTTLFQRIVAAQNNLVDGFPGFIAAVFVATLCKVPFHLRFALSTLVVLSRIAYVTVYMLNLPTLRSFTWVHATMCCYALFVLALLPNSETRLASIADIVVSRVSFLNKLGGSLFTVA